MAAGSGPEGADVRRSPTAALVALQGGGTHRGRRAPTTVPRWAARGSHGRRPSCAATSQALTQVLD